MRNIFYLVYVSLLFFGCNTQKDDFTDTLTSKSKEDKLWNYYATDDNGDYTYLGYKYLFNKRNTYEIYNSKNMNEKGVSYTEFNIHGNSAIANWSFVSDSMYLALEFDSFIIDRYNSDTIVMRGDGFEGGFMMVKMKDVGGE